MKSQITDDRIEWSERTWDQELYLMVQETLKKVHAKGMINNVKTNRIM